MKITLICLLAFLSIVPLQAQSDYIHFQHIGVNEGLSQSTVLGITQDKQGNLWIATHDGLNKFNGSDFTIYRNNTWESRSIAGNVIHTCLNDSRNRIWAGTNVGLSLYDPTDESFSNFICKQQEKMLGIREIVEIDEHRLLVVPSKGSKLQIFHTNTRQFGDEPLHSQLTSVIPTTINRQDSSIYIGSYQGIYVYSILNNTIRHITSPALENTQILTILQQGNKALWVGTEGKGLFRIDLNNNKTIHFFHSPGQKNGISSNYVRSLAFDSQNRLWIGTSQALDIYDDKSGTFSNHTSNLQEHGSLSQTSVRSIFMDSQGGMWIGTFYGGLNYYHLLRNRFQNIQSTLQSNSLNNNTIGCLYEDENQNLWIGTNNGGVNCYDPHSQSFTHYTQKQGLRANDIKSLYIDKENDLVYIGTHSGGLNILHRKSGRIKTAYEGSSKNIYDIEPTEDGRLWMAGATVLKCFDPRLNKSTNLRLSADGKPLPQETFRNFLRDSKRRLWIGGSKGMAIYTENKGELTVCTLLPADSPLNRVAVNHVFEAKNGIFWIGTSNGIYSFDEQTKNVKQYTTDQGLPNNTVHCILEDASGRLWLSTNKGISCLNPENETFRNYNSKDGLASDEFIDNAGCRGSNGKMYFGSINGIVVFHPDRMLDNQYIPPVIITRLKLFNEVVHAGDNTGILEKNISETKYITLSAGQSMFSLDFAAPNYISSGQNTYAYMLQGFDSDWRYTTNQRTVSYSNLPHGTYHFLVKAANNDGKWNETPTKLTITMLPVWYKTWWATLLYMLFFIAVFYAIFRYFWMRKTMEAQLQMERIDKERQQEVNEMKLRFFINISHELRTPLTLILAPLQEVMPKINDLWIQKQLEYVHRNTNRLLHLVNQLMDYRRAELGVFHLKVKPCSIHQTIEKVIFFYSRMAQQRQIEYTFNSELKDRNILCDPNYIELIANNLISNAFKYTGNGKSITINLKEENNLLLLQVKDTGHGISTDKQKKIFERFYQADSEHFGSGIGLSLVQRLVDLHHGEIKLESEKGKGSEFTVILPTDLSAYTQEEIAENQKNTDEQQNYTTNEQTMYLIGAENNEHSAVTAEEQIDSVQHVTDKEQHKETILLVEDNVDIQQYLSEELGKIYHILQASNGEEALTLIKGREIDLILTDVMMPVLDGIQMCKRIKQNINTCHIPIIMLSAKTDIKEQLEGLQIGADDYIPKPFSMEIVKAKIKNLFLTRYRAIKHYNNSIEIEPEQMHLHPLDEEFLNRAVAIMEKYMDDIEFTTEKFARELCMSRSSLHVKMKALTGETTNDFIRKIRFNRAGQLLKEGRYTVSEVSLMVGFSTPAYFTNCFKKFFGCLPSEYGKNK